MIMLSSRITIYGLQNTILHTPLHADQPNNISTEINVTLLKNTDITEHPKS
jgi:hypothetical protein